MIFTDTHSHLYDQKFSEDREEVIARAFEENVKRIFIPNVDQHTVEGMMKIVSAHPQKCFPMMGLHPCHVKKDFKAELTVLKIHLDKGGFCAVGEIGMDLYWDKTFVEEQKEAFRIQIHWAKKKLCPLPSIAEMLLMRSSRSLKTRKMSYFEVFSNCFSGTLDKPTESSILIFIWVLVVLLPLKMRD